MTSTRELCLLSNQADIGGGEVMLLAMARAARDMGATVRVVVPDGETARAADELGVHVDLVRANNRRDHLLQLGRWAAASRADQLLWCNGLFPAVATLGRARRIVHLHQVPQSRAQAALLATARRRAAAIYVPSAYVSHVVPGSTVLLNWTADIAFRPRPLQQAPVRVGFVGRPSPIKGFVTLCSALSGLIDQHQDTLELVVAGEPKFVSPADQAAVEAAIAPISGAVRRLGWVERNDFYDAVDLVVVPSLVAESFGLVAAEAMAAGRPVIVSDAGALPEVVGAEHPWIVPAARPDALADMIRTVIDSDPRDPVAAARARWDRDFSPTAGSARIQQALARHGLVPSPDGGRDD